MPPHPLDCTAHQRIAAVEPVNGIPPPAKPASSPDGMDAWWDTAFKAWRVEAPPQAEPLTPPCA